MLTTPLHLAPMLRMNGAVTLFPLYAFVAWTGTFYLLTVSQFLHYRDPLTWAFYL